ncbi:hypothetical protein NEDG_02093 [Nematocida displodere]|uniref:Uncharacterized protein n=1 Tax=Nematocida displodere TaxID=1805483 RepID=A0A177EJL0_9MICR|nr:hypothetical protein NEDG_02093 [Nematocida displodere]
MRKNTFALAVCFLSDYARCLVNTYERPAFGNGVPGYFYNVGGKMYLTKKKSEHDSFVWIGGTPDPKSATKLMIQRQSIHGYTSNLIISEDFDDVQLRKTRLHPGRSKNTFHGFPSFSLIDGWKHPHVVLSVSTASPSNWFSFSPPVILENNAFRVYAGNKCLAMEREGYLFVQECISYPEERRNMQLFTWLSEEQYTSVKGVPVKREPGTLLYRRPMKVVPRAHNLRTLVDPYDLEPPIQARLRHYPTARAFKNLATAQYLTQDLYNRHPNHPEDEEADSNYSSLENSSKPLLPQSLPITRPETNPNTNAAINTVSPPFNISEKLPKHSTLQDQPAPEPETKPEHRSAPETYPTPKTN